MWVWLLCAVGHMTFVWQVLGSPDWPVQQQPECVWRSGSPEGCSSASGPSSVGGNSPYTSPIEQRAEGPTSHLCAGSACPVNAGYVELPGWSALKPRWRAGCPFGSEESCRCRRAAWFDSCRPPLEEKHLHCMLVSLYKLMGQSVIFGKISGAKFRANIPAHNPGEHFWWILDALQKLCLKRRHTLLDFG